MFTSISFWAEILLYALLFIIYVWKARKNSLEKNNQTWSVREGMLIALSVFKAGVILSLGELINKYYPTEYVAGIALGYIIAILLFIAEQALSYRLISKDYLTGMRQGTTVYRKWNKKP